MKPPSHPLVIFDLDGTLADSFPWFLRVVNTVAREYRFNEIAEADIGPLRRTGSREILTKLNVPPWKVPLIARRMRALKRAHLDDIGLFPGVDEMLRGLTVRGIRLALVSSDSEANARRQLGPENVALFSYFECGTSLFGKAAKFKRVLKRAGLAPNHAMAIGDEVRDAEAARLAGVAFGAVTWGYADPDALRARAPDVVFAAMDQIVKELT
ncbi:MAG TPA: HAD hydrolase-like protein [Pseudolabrys sp.]|jgi:phosphoglycolate phosphatase|nr:HAD hydrolase-like protein [Pseudolabrys sp.]